MAEGFPLSDTISFETRAGWYDLMITTAAIPASLSDDGHAAFRTVVDLHAPNTEEGTATLLQGLLRDYATAADAIAGHAEVLRQVKEREVALPIPDQITDERKLRG
ncbi:MAG TPA: hypothetical protein VIU62_12090 [Chloroflexota bacterium]|jgi:hypothetical protein